MGDLIRSQPMQLIRLFVQVEAAHDTIDELGKVGLIQFRDLNPEVNAFQRNFVTEVKRCDEMDRKLRYFEDQVNKNEVQIVGPTAKDILLCSESHEGDRLSLDELEAVFEDLERELLQLNTNQETLDRNYNKLIEQRYVLVKDDTFFGSNHGQGGHHHHAGAADHVEDFGARSPLINPEGVSHASDLRLITGVLERSKMHSFQRILWRTMRGNLYMNEAEIEDYIKDPVTGEYVEKNVFIVFVQGQQTEAKILKVCEAFGANTYTCPQDVHHRAEMRSQIEVRLEDLKRVLERTNEHNLRVLAKVASQLELWKAQVLREKSIYHTMNLFNYDVGRRCLIAEGWCPDNDNDRRTIAEALRVANNRSGALAKTVLQVVDTVDTPPTYYKTNMFTENFQAIIDSYGIARYREINPAPFTVITFPFLFGVMFGDVGHGFIFFLIALYLLWNEKKFLKMNLNEMVEMLFTGRYLFLLMSIFSIYCGALYNEYFGLAADWFGTTWCWEPNGVSEPIYEGTSATLCYQLDGSDPRAYPFGVDPMWKWSENELDYYNSLKMKMSVLMGVTQMVFGIILGLFNHVHFRKPLNIIFEWIPQMVFILSIFGYMDLLIVYKWLINWYNPHFGVDNQAGPRLINLMIFMFLTPWKLEDQYLMFPGQLYVQWVLIILAVIAVPMMLFPKPLIMRWQYYRAHPEAKNKNKKKEAEGGYQALSVDDHDHDHEHHEGAHHEGGGHGGHGEHGEEFDFGDIFVHQCIHTIEYVLGCVSNTASYLRLWALSLAHAQLAEVFYQRAWLFSMTMQFSNFFTVFVGWAIWAGLTVGVLLVMESLSAFLHALRLHWVEFQNKFFMADGHKFLPFSYKNVLEEEAKKAKDARSTQ